ncbi:hypothetical protein K502DRAFT_296891 [Neoconidiobolus thromboides FSU 785]|nr:hypothetical protein K502DRAFT_296891 [Neoconidiobolus thromboides FSU 785]
MEDIQIWGDIQKVTKEYIILRIKDSEGENKIKGKNCELIVKDLSLIHQNRKINKSSILIEDNYFEDFKSYEELKTTLNKWNQQFDKCMEIINIGNTHEGRDLLAIKISNNKQINNKKSIWFNGGLHAREWISPALVMYQIYKFCKLKKEQDKLNEEILSQFDLYFTPLSNPDGYEFSRNKDRLWRKNRSKNKDGTFGVDLNRNFGFKWGTIGSSNNTNSEIYHGEGPLSELETSNLIKFAKTIPNRYAAIDWHSYGQMILRPWGYQTNLASNNEKYLKVLGDRMQQVFKKYNYNYESELSAGLYPAGGAMDDFLNAELNFQAFTIELCPNDDKIGFLLPKEEIIPCSEAAYNASLYYLKFFMKFKNLMPNTNFI